MPELGVEPAKGTSGRMSWRGWPFRNSGLVRSSGRQTSPHFPSGGLQRGCRGWSIPLPNPDGTQEPFTDVLPLVPPLLVTSGVGEDGLAASDGGGCDDRLGVLLSTSSISPNRGIHSIGQTGSRSRSTRHLELLAIPQRKRFLWLGLDRNRREHGCLGLTNSRKGGGGPGFGSGGNFVLGLHQHPE